METNYRKIQFGAGDSIERAMQYLARFKERGELFAKIDAVNHELKTTRSTMAALKSHYEKVIDLTQATSPVPQMQLKDSLLSLLDPDDIKKIYNLHFLHIPNICNL